VHNALRAQCAACTMRCTCTAPPTCRADPRSRGAALRLRGGRVDGREAAAGTQRARAGGRPEGCGGRRCGGGKAGTAVFVAAVPEEQPGMVRPLSVFWQRRLLDL